jgi:hypothetical protein
MDLFGLACGITTVLLVGGLLVVVAARPRPAKDKLAGTFLLRYSPESRMVEFTTDVPQGRLVELYSYYLDRQVANCGDAAAPYVQELGQLATRLMDFYKSEAKPGEQSAVSALPRASAVGPSVGPWIVVHGQVYDDPVRVFLDVPHFTSHRVEDVMMSGCIELFYYLFPRLDPIDQARLVCALSTLCLHYRIAGLPSPFQLRKAPVEAMKAVSVAFDRF